VARGDEQELGIKVGDDLFKTCRDGGWEGIWTDDWTTLAFGTPFKDDRR
jgi:hypothetical protein